MAELDNIGEEYAETRHNIGFSVLDNLSVKEKLDWQLDRHAYITQYRFKGRSFILIKPTTYMNLSGKAVKYWLDKEKIPLEHLLVIADDVDLDTGILRLRAKGSGGSHNGLNHIIETLGTTEWPRLRVGIGKDYAKGFQVDYVLGSWTKSEEKLMIPRVELAVELIKSFVLSGIHRTMSDFNVK